MPNRYYIFQIDNDADYEFMNYDYASNHGFDRHDYRIVYSEPYNNESLDQIYYRFNNNRPADFKGHSLSVSDVILFDMAFGLVAYYIDSFGFTEVPEFTKGYTRFDIGGSWMSVKYEVILERRDEDDELCESDSMDYGDKLSDIMFAARGYVNGLVDDWGLIEQYKKDARPTDSIKIYIAEYLNERLTDYKYVGTIK